MNPSTVFSKRVITARLWDRIRISSLVGLVIGIGFSIPTGLPGNVRGSELILIGLFPLALFWQKSLPQVVKRNMMAIQVSLGVMILYQLISDISVNQTPMQRMLSGNASVGLCLVNFTSIANLLLKFPVCLEPFFLGFAAGSYFLTSELQVGQKILDNEYWDLRVASWGGPLLFFVIAIVSNWSSLIARIIATVYAVLAMAYGARSHGLMVLIGVSITYLMMPFGGWMRNRYEASVARFAVGGLAFMFLGTVLYIEAASAGLLRSKAEMQVRSISNPYNPIELIATGRDGVFLGLQGIQLSPFFGYGSMAYSNQYTEFGFSPSGFNYVHSGIVEATLYGGVPIGLLWCYVLCTQLRIFPGSIKTTSVAYGYEIIGSIAMFSAIWHLLFSPLVSLRFTWAISLAIQVLCYAITRFDSLSNSLSVQPNENFEKQSHQPNYNFGPKINR